MNRTFEKTVLGLFQTVLERIDFLERKITSTGNCPHEEARRWTPKDVQHRFGLGLRQQYNLRAKGILPYFQKTPNGPISYLPADVLDYYFGDGGIPPQKQP